MADNVRVRGNDGRLTGLAITLAASFAAAIMLLLVFAEDFPSALRLFFLSPFGNTYAFGNMLAFTLPLMLAGLGVSVAFASRNFNLGGEGQVYAGGLVAVLVCLAFSGGRSPESPIVFPFGVQVTAALAAALAGGLIGMLSGLLKRLIDVDELISSFLISAIVVLAVDYLITGPFQDASSNFQTTLPIDPRLRFARILPPSSLSTGIFLGLAASLIAKLVFDRTRFGFELRVYGLGGEFARYCGIDTGLYTLLPMGLSGALHGLAGAAIIMGSQFKAMRGFSSGVGWGAISVALIAHNDPLAVIPSAFFLAYLEAGAKGVMIGSNVTSEIVAVVQAVIFFLITARFASKARKRMPKRARP